ncbi:MAG: FliA/WhiG family RNA polymerase sigma factor [Nitriliruptorales bacterium]|nr:FliA/WhiG family RNA polymerase sigma factor [Nitriliruptorales bacterium]
MTTPGAAVVDDDVIVDHLPLVRQIVHQLARRFPSHVDRDELLNAGVYGLVDASHRFDPSTGVPFGRFAAIRIRGAILDSTRSRDWSTRGVRRRLRRIRRAEEVMTSKLGRKPSDEELAAELDLSVDEIHHTRHRGRQSTLLHLDHPVLTDEGESSTLGDLVQETDDTALPELALEERELIGTLRAAVARLPARQRDVIQRYYFRHDLLRDIADDLGVSEARISQIRAEAITAIRAYFQGTFEGVPAVEPEAPGARKRDAFVEAIGRETTWRSRLDAAGAAVA